jgi:hypothetical protein
MFQDKGARNNSPGDPHFFTLGYVVWNEDFEKNITVRFL